MSNDINQLIDAINDLEATDDVKQGLIKKVQTSGITAELLDEIRPYIEKMAEQDEADDPQIQAIIDDGVAQLDQATQEFEQEIAEIEENVAQIYEKASSTIDEIELDQAQQSANQA